MHDVEIWVDVAFFRKNAWVQAFALLAQTRGEKTIDCGGHPAIFKAWGSFPLLHQAQVEAHDLPMTVEMTVARRSPWEAGDQGFRIDKPEPQHKAPAYG